MKKKGGQNKRVLVLSVRIVIITVLAGVVTIGQANAWMLTKQLQFAQQFAEVDSLKHAREYCTKGLDNSGGQKPNFMINEDNNDIASGRYGWKMKIPTLDEIMHLEGNSSWTPYGYAETTDSFALTTTQCDNPQGTDYGKPTEDGINLNSRSTLVGFVAINRNNKTVCITEYALMDWEDIVVPHGEDPIYHDSLNAGPTDEKRGAILVTTTDAPARKNVGVICVKQKMVSAQ